MGELPLPRLNLGLFDSDFVEINDFLEALFSICRFKPLSKINVSDLQTT